MKQPAALDSWLPKSQSVGNLRHLTAAGPFAVASVVLALVILAAAVRIMTPDPSLWIDEIASVKFAREPLQHLWSDWMLRETNPPLYYTVLHGWIDLFGEADMTVRLLSIAVGILGVALIFLLGRRVGGDGVGLLSATLLAVSQQDIFYSQQVRGYIFAHTAAMAAILGVVLFLDGEQASARSRRSALGLYFISCLIALYCHTMMVILPFLANLFVVARLKPWTGRWAAFMEWVGVNLVLLLAWAWWGRITLLQSGSTHDNIGWIDPTTVRQAINMTLQGDVPPIGRFHAMVEYLYIAAFAVTAWRLRRSSAFFLVVVAVGAPVCLFLLSRVIPVFLPRVIYWTSSAFIVGVSAGLFALKDKRLVVAAATLAVIASLSGLFSDRWREPWKEIAESLSSLHDDHIVLAGSRPIALAIERYCSAPACAVYALDRSEGWSHDMPGVNVVADADIEKLLDRSDEVIAIQRGPSDPAPLLRALADPAPPPPMPDLPPYMAVTAWRKR